MRTPGVIMPLDVDPEVDPINVLDLNLDRRDGAGPGVLSAIHDATLVALQQGQPCDGSAFAGAGSRSARGGSRWCVRTRAGTVVELSLLGYDTTGATYLAYQRRP
jgi:hypothetical protein